MPGRIVETASFGNSADAQLSSPFFTLLPAEIRNLIYGELWNLASARQHIVKKDAPDRPTGEQWGRIPCLVTIQTDDRRFDEFAASHPASAARNLWGRRLKSEWCLHWPCEELGEYPCKARTATGLRTPGDGDESSDPVEGDAGPFTEGDSARPLSAKAGYIDVLTACKRMYLECLPSLYANTTFIFTDTRTAGEFVSHYGADPERYPLRSLELSIRVTNLITEIYYPHAGGSSGDEGPPAIFAGRARPMLSARHNPWQHLCDGLAALPGLQDLRIWLDSSDLRPWHKRVNETRFFDRLRDVQVPDKRRFVLGLPELPTRRGPDSQALAAYYLEGDKLHNVPFTVERGPRPNNWSVHLNIFRAAPVAQ